MTNHKFAAFSLVEVALALGIAAFCLITLFGLLPVGMTSNQASVTQSGAANIAVGLMGDLQVTKVTTPRSDVVSPLFKLKIPSIGSATHTVFFRADGSAAGKVDTDADPTLDPFYRALVVLGPDPTLGGRATSVRLLITWPALADRKQGVTPVNFSGSFETVAALNRN